MEREIMLTGIGGQSVQLAAQILARAALREGKYAMYLGVYGGTMRGGNTDSTVIVGDAPIVSPPIVSSTWSALVMHHQFWDPLRDKLQPDSVVVVNSSLFDAAEEPEGTTHRVFEVPATEMATELGNALGASLVLLGAFVSLTELLGLDALIAGMRDSIPSYRQQHLAANEKALRAGFEVLPAGAAPAWVEGGSTR